MIALKRCRERRKCQSFSFTCFLVDCTLISRQDRHERRNGREMKYLLSNKTRIWWRIMKLLLEGAVELGWMLPGTYFCDFIVMTTMMGMWDVWCWDIHVSFSWLIYSVNWYGWNFLNCVSPNAKSIFVSEEAHRKLRIYDIKQGLSWHLLLQRS